VGFFRSGRRGPFRMALVRSVN